MKLSPNVIKCHYLFMLLLKCEKCDKRKPRQWKCCRGVLLEVVKCQEKQSTLAITQAATGWLKKGFVSSTDVKEGRPTSATAGTRLPEGGMAGLGSVSVTGTTYHIPTASCVTNAAWWLRQKRYIISYPLQKVEHMIGTTWWVYASHVMQRYMASVVIEKIKIKYIHTKSKC